MGQVKTNSGALALLRQKFADIVALHGFGSSAFKFVFPRNSSLPQASQEHAQEKFSVHKSSGRFKRNTHCQAKQSYYS